MFYVLEGRLYALMSQTEDGDRYLNVATGDIIYGAARDIWSSRWGSCDPKRIYV